MFELTTLLMIAVAVAMSVIIFMWSQGFLSQTSSATGGQQGAQNQAAQSSVSIELATFVPLYWPRHSADMCWWDFAQDDHRGP